MQYYIAKSNVRSNPLHSVTCIFLYVYLTKFKLNLMLVQYVIASHAEVWTCQFGWEFYQELTVTMVQVSEGTAVSTQGQHYIQ